MKIQSSNNYFLFKGQPHNYVKINEFVSRSAQPQKEDFSWLKSQGVTDIINFRTMYEPKLNFDEKFVVKNYGMNYHNIPTNTSKPNEEKVNSFLKLVDDIVNKGGKVHIHCKAGADRTGMYAFIYKSIKNIGTVLENEKEWLLHGHNVKIFPNLIGWAKDFVKKQKM